MKFCLFFLLFGSCIFGDFSFFEMLEESNDLNLPEKEILFVSLGPDCGVASALRQFDLRKCAFPLDWVVSMNLDRVIHLLENDFLGFLDIENLKRDVLDPGFVTNLLYNIDFLHDWHLKNLDFSKENCRENVQYMKEKYQRRIQRFKQLDKYQGRVVFIRCGSNISLDQAVRLRNALDHFFPSLDFWLLLANFVEESFDYKIGQEDRIFEFKINKPSLLNTSSEDLQYFKEVLEFLKRQDFLFTHLLN